MRTDEALADLGVTLKSHAQGKHRTTCPQCSEQRKRHNRKKTCLAVWIEAESVSAFCIHCGWKAFKSTKEHHAPHAR